MIPIKIINEDFIYIKSVKIRVADFKLTLFKLALDDFFPNFNLLPVR
jgi:hypothetical protein